MIKDIYGTKLNIDFSRSGYFRIDFEDHTWPEYKHSRTGEILPYCIAMTRKQAKALVSHLEMMLESEAGDE